jgi:serine/threonine-protein kinase 24/25/MST4
MKPGRFREDYIAIVIRELLKGLDYLHGEGKLHRDIKGERRWILVAGKSFTDFSLQPPMSSSPPLVKSSWPTLA